MKYPGRIIKKKEKDKNIVNAIQTQLNTAGCGPIEVDGDYGGNTFNAVKLFQARTTDPNGTLLSIDGEVGSITWAALFGANTVTQNSRPPSTKLSERALEIAISQLGVREVGGANKGPEVKKYLKSVGIDFPAPWCMAFLYWCYEQAANEQNVRNPLVKTGGVLRGWNEATCTKIKAKSAHDNPALVKPGHIFILDFGSGLGHTGIIKSVEGGLMTTIEGNSNNTGSREGIGVFELKTRKIKNVNKGFLEY